LLQTDRLRNVALGRAFDLLTHQADEQRVMFFPLGCASTAPARCTMVHPVRNG
jgi:hypothetical protein